MKHRIQLGAMLNNLGMTDVGAEVGVFQGDFAEELLTYWQGNLLLGVDIWDLPGHPPNLKAKTTARLRQFGDRWQSIDGDSVAAAEQIKDGSLDFVYIDADHSYGSCKRDLEAWYPKVKPGGVLSGHDYWNGYRNQQTKSRRDVPNPTPQDLQKMNFGVKAAVDEFIAKHGLPKPQITKEWPPSWWLQLPA